MSRMVQTSYEEFLVSIKLLSKFPKDFSYPFEMKTELEYLYKRINIKESISIIGEAGSRFEVRRRGEYQSFVT